MRRTLTWLKRHLDVLSVQGDTLQDAVFYVSTDSRKFLVASKTLFVALKTTQRDGHSFIQAAYQAGVRVFLVTTVPVLADYPNAQFFQVANAQSSLQKIAAAWRSTFSIPVVGITGSNGKTVVKEWLFQLVQHKLNVVRSPGSFNSQIGVPLSVWQMGAEHQLAIFEAGISQTNEMQALENIIQPTIGIFTDMGTAHDAGFSSQKEKIAEKIALFEHCNVVIYGMDDDLVQAAMEAWQKAKPGRRLLSISEKKHSNATFFITHKRIKKDIFTHVELLYEGQKRSFSIPFTDQASFSNALRCYVFLVEMQFSTRTIQHRMRNLQSVKMRMEIIAGIHRCTLINDSYTNDLTSLSIALEQASRQTSKKKLSLILSDLLQSKKEDLYAEIALLIQQYQVARLIAIGEKIQVIAKYLPKEIEQFFYPDTVAFLADFHAVHFEEEVILLKGARQFAFEKIAQRLEMRSHKTQMEIDLAALAHNLNVYRRCLKAGTKILVMVKASGYGSGSEQVSQLLQYQGVDYLGVAYADEGVFLRERSIHLPILVLNSDASEFDLLARHNLEPEIFSLEHLRDLLAFCRSTKQKLRIHLKFNTGMNRLGFQPEDIEALHGLLAVKNPYVEVASVFSHLAGSDASCYDDYTKAQVSIFVDFFEKTKDVLPKNILRHIANTGGIVRHPEAHFEMVRLGIGLYGVKAGTTPIPLQVVNTVKATINQIRKLPAGATIGYNRASTLTRASLIATVNIGYADGLLRQAGQGRYALGLHGKRAPIVGNVCMDMCMIDVTDIPQVHVGDEVEVFGKNVPVEELAEALGTISYEIFTRISERVKRVYIQE